jgi:hypothetical protein
MACIYIFRRLTIVVHVDHDKFSEIHARSLLDPPTTMSQSKGRNRSEVGLRQGMHSIWGRYGLIAITLSNSKYSVFIRISNAETRNIAFRQLIEDPKVHIIGFHPERVALALYATFGYQMEAFYEFNTTNPPRRSIDDVYCRYILRHPEKPSFDEVFFCQIQNGGKLKHTRTLKKSTLLREIVLRWHAIWENC